MIEIFKEKKINKIFCIGHNKTGTCSLQQALEDLGISTGNQGKGEKLFDDYLKGNYKPIIKYCKSAQAFQDIPFSLPYLFCVLDAVFPGSKFVLSVRDSPEQWYNSLIKYHGNKYGEGSIPTSEVLKKVPYRYEGFVYSTVKNIYGTDDDDLYNKQMLINFYQRHNAMAHEYFRFRPNDFIEVNIANKNSYKKLSEFLGKEPVSDQFPWLNKS